MEFFRLGFAGELRGDNQVKAQMKRMPKAGFCTCCGSSPLEASSSSVLVRISCKLEFSLPEGVPRVPKYYAVRKGYRQRIFYSWDACKWYIKEYSGS